MLSLFRVCSFCAYTVRCFEHGPLGATGFCFQYRVWQGAPESPAIFVAVSDHIFIYITSIAGDICLLASNRKDQGMHCWLQGRRPGNGHLRDLLDKHIPLTDSFSEHRQSLDPMVRKITCVGAKIHLCSNSRSAMTNRQHTLRHNPGFDKTHPLLQVVNALQPGMTERLLDPCEDARILLGFLERTAPRAHARHWTLVGSFWMWMHRVGHQCMKQRDTSLVTTFRTQKHRMAGHYVRLRHAHRCQDAQLPGPQLVARATAKLGSERRPVERRASGTIRLLEVVVRFRARTRLVHARHGRMRHRSRPEGLSPVPTSLESTGA